MSNIRIDYDVSWYKKRRLSLWGCSRFRPDIAHVHFMLSDKVDYGERVCLDVNVQGDLVRTLCAGIYQCDRIAFVCLLVGILTSDSR